MRRGLMRKANMAAPEVNKPRDVPVSLCTLAIAAVRAWRGAAIEGMIACEDLDEAMNALEAHLGPLVAREAA